MKALPIIALLTLTPALAGCDLLDIMTGHKTKAQRDYETAQARATVSLPADRVLDVAPMLGAPEPDPAPPPALIAAAEIPPAVQPEPPGVRRYGDVDYICTPTFRILSCDDDGRPHHLGSNMEWLD